MNETDFYLAIKPYLPNLPMIILSILYAAILLKKYVINGTTQRYFQEEKRNRNVMRKILTSLVNVEKRQEEFFVTMAERRKTNVKEESTGS